MKYPATYGHGLETEVDPLGFLCFNNTQKLLQIEHDFKNGRSSSVSLSCSELVLDIFEENSDEMDSLHEMERCKEKGVCPIDEFLQN